VGHTALADLPASPPPLPAPVVDSHTHLDITADRSDLTVALNLARAAEAGVSHVIDVGVDVASSRACAANAERFGPVQAAVAIHPNDAPGLADLDADLAAIAELAALPQVRAVGETGLDYYRTREAAARAVQHTSFRAHIAIAKETSKALVIHDREAHGDILAVLADAGAPERVVFHCFSGDESMARLCAEHGWYVSFAGNVTFRNARDLQAAAAVVPQNLLLVETDAPFLTPMPERGRRNAPYLLPHTVRFLAQLRGEDLEGLCGALTRNADAVFGPL
jgi:TatD DNase family protein